MKPFITIFNYNADFECSCWLWCAETCYVISGEEPSQVLNTSPYSVSSDAMDNV